MCRSGFDQVVTAVILEFNTQVGVEHQVRIFAFSDREELLDVDALIALAINPALVG